MQHSTDSDGVRLVPAVVMGFLLGAGQVNHAIVASLLCFAALHAGAPLGYADSLGLLAFAALGNTPGPHRTRRDVGPHRRGPRPPRRAAPCIAS
ncbi:MAG TPA: hypothetical protein VGJ13_13000 [Pseudonocardiaceae bacterium]